MALTPYEWNQLEILLDRNPFLVIVSDTVKQTLKALKDTIDRPENSRYELFGETHGSRSRSPSLELRLSKRGPYARIQVFRPGQTMVGLKFQQHRPIIIDSSSSIKENLEHLRETALDGEVRVMAKTKNGFLFRIYEL